MINLFVCLPEYKHFIQHTEQTEITLHFNIACHKRLLERFLSLYDLLQYFFRKCHLNIGFCPCFL